MTCANCEVLRETIKKLERKLALRLDNSNVGALMSAFDMRPQEARVALALYQAGGKFVPHDALIDGMISAGTGLQIRVVVSRVRQALGVEVENRHQIGYALGADGLAKIMAVLEPVVLQDVRGDLTEAEPRVQE